MQCCSKRNAASFVELLLDMASVSQEYNVLSGMVNLLILLTMFIVRNKVHVFACVLKSISRLRYCFAEISRKQPSSYHVHEANALVRSVPGLRTKFDQGIIGFSIFIVVYSVLAALLFPTHIV